MAKTYSMDEEEKKEDELVFGLRDYDAPRKEPTMKDFEPDKPKRTTRDKFNDKFIKREGGGFARRGTAGAQRAENKERNKKRAQEAARKRREAKKK